MKTTQEHIELNATSQGVDCDKNGVSLCVNTDTPPPGSTDYEEVVSHAISLAAANGREPKQPSPNASKSSNKPRSNPSQRNLCFQCRHRGSIPGDAHIKCEHPMVMKSVDRITSPLLLMSGMTSGLMKRMNISGDSHGIKQGWFLWPLNFDPTWLLSCDKYEE